MSFTLMPTLLQASEAEAGDGDFNVIGDEIFATFSPWASWLSDGNPFAPVTLLPASVDGSAGAQGNPDSIVAVTSGGLTINLIYDTAALNAPQGFRDGIQQAVAIMAAAISDKITVNIKIDYSGTGRGAAAGPDNGRYEPYSWVRDNLVRNATPGDTTFNALTAGSTIQGQSNVAVWNAQLKLWGVIGANDTTTDDGAATFATDIDPNLLVGVALHELTHAMGRIPYGASSQPDIFDFYRFTSPGTRLFLGGATAPAAYFSLDGGITKVADYGRTSDASDFLNSGVQGANDPFNEFYNGGTSQKLTAADLKQLDALGFHLVTSDTHAPLVTVDNALSVQAGATLAITSAQLVAVDDVSPAAQVHYTVTTGPAYGTLLLGAAATSSFTQADINSGLVSYHEILNGVTSDAFSFTVSDAAGNTSGTTAFHINVNPALVPQAFTSGGIWSSAGNGSDNTWHVGDFNGDGKADIFRYLNGEDMFLSSGAGFTHNGLWSPAGNGSDNQWHVGDFNGDGKDDVFRFIDGTGDQMFLSNGSSFVYNGVWTPAGAGLDGTWHVGDFNGDGKADVFRYLSGGEDVFLSNGTSFVHSGIWSPAGNGSDGQWYLGDFNGDGKTDIFRYLAGQSGADVFLSNGSSFVHDSSWTGAGIGVDGTWHLGDFNGDGKTDIFRYLASQSGADVFLSTGSSFVHDGSWSSASIGTDNQWYVGDFNGGGADDIFRQFSGVDMLLSHFG